MRGVGRKQEEFERSISDICIIWKQKICQQQKAIGPIKVAGLKKATAGNLYKQAPIQHMPNQPLRDCQ